MTSIGLRPALLFFSLTAVNTAASISARKLSNGTTRAIISSGSPFAEIAASPLSASKNPNCPIVPTPANLVVTSQTRTNSRRSLFFEVPYTRQFETSPRGDRTLRKRYRVQGSERPTRSRCRRHRRRRAEARCRCLTPTAPSGLRVEQQYEYDLAQKRQESGQSRARIRAVCSCACRDGRQLAVNDGSRPDPNEIHDKHHHDHVEI